MLLPLLSLLLWRRPRLMLLFAICGLVHPAFWLAGNWLHSGDAWYGFTAAGRWEIESMGRAQVGRGLLAGQAAAYPLSVVEGMSLPIGLICVAGVALALAARHRGAVWLLPLVGVLGLWALGIARGALVPKLNYTEIAGTLLFPFLGVVYQRLGTDRWRPRRLLLIAIALPVASLVFSCRPCLARVRMGRLAVFSPVPRIENQRTALALAGTLREVLRPGGSALVSDHYGWGATQYVALLTRLPRPRIFLARGAPNRQLDPDSLATFLRRHPQGVIVALSGSRFSRLLDLASGARNATVGDISLRLTLVHAIVWPGRDPATLMMFRYWATGDGAVGWQQE